MTPINRRTLNAIPMIVMVFLFMISGRFLNAPEVIQQSTIRIEKVEVNAVENMQVKHVRYAK